MISGPLLKAGALFQGYRIIKPASVNGGNSYGSIQAYQARRASELRLDALLTIYCMRPPSPAQALDVAADFAKGVERLKALRLPELPEVEAGGFAEGILWVAVQDVRGDILKNLLMNCGPTEPLPLPMCLRLVASIARVFKAASEQGVFHYGFTAYDVICSPDLELRKMTGMGILQLFGKTDPLPGPKWRLPCMAPEQLRKSGVVGPKTDVYLVGLLFYELCTLDLPFTNAQGQAPSGDWLLGAIVNSALDPLSSKLGCPEFVDRFLRRLVASDPERRADWQMIINEAEATAERLEQLTRPIAPQAAQGEETDRDSGNEGGSAGITRDTLPDPPSASPQPEAASSSSTVLAPSTAAQGEAGRSSGRAGRTRSARRPSRLLWNALAVGAALLVGFAVRSLVGRAPIAMSALHMVRPVLIVQQQPPTESEAPHIAPEPLPANVRDGRRPKIRLARAEWEDSCEDGWAECDPPEPLDVAPEKR